MKVRTIAGLGMTLLAAGLMTIHFLNPDFPGGSPSPSGPEAEESAADETAKDSPDDINEFLAQYNATYRALWTDAANADWISRTMISPESLAALRGARSRLTEFTGSQAVVQKLRLYRGRLDLSDLQDRQIETAWRLATHDPAAAGGTRSRITAATAAWQDSLETFLYPAPTVDQPDRRVPLEQIDRLLAASRDTTGRRSLWEGRMAVGPYLKDGVVQLQGLRNSLAREMGYSSFFGLEAAEYGLSGSELILLMDELTAGVAPLYGHLHCWVKHELARRYAAEPPRRIPIHWLDDPWGGTWPTVVESVDLDAHFRDLPTQWIIEEAERFYISLGFAPLPLTFWGRSDLFVPGADSDRRKSSQAVSLHLDLEQDVRCLLNLQQDFPSFLAAHQQLGIVYYELAYSRPELPPVLRRGANPAFPRALGALGGMAASQIPYLREVDVLPPEESPEEIRWLMSQALLGPVVSIPFLCGTLAHWENDLYEEDLPRHQFNTRWWEYAGRYQGLQPPSPRGEDFCDPASLPLLQSSPARGYEQAISEVIMHQLHRYICREILGQDVRSADYAGNNNVGIFLNSIMASGAARGWSQVLRQAIGEELSAQALVEYYQPLLEWLQTQNQGRDIEF